MLIIGVNMSLQLDGNCETLYKLPEHKTFFLNKIYYFPILNATHPQSSQFFSLLRNPARPILVTPNSILTGNGKVPTVSDE